jgi:hypothetical protein
LARSDGAKVLTNGTAAARPPTAPAQLDAISHVRLAWSTCWSLMNFLEQMRRQMAGKAKNPAEN